MTQSEEDETNMIITSC